MSSRESPGGPSIGVDDTSQPPPTTGSTPFSFRCGCLNLRVDGQIRRDDASKVEGESSSKQVRVWLGKRSETPRLLAYITWEQDERRPSRSGTRQTHDTSDDTPSRSWRKCWICGVRCYEGKGKGKAELAAEEVWVNVDLSSGILYGTGFDNPAGASLPCSSLLLPLPSSTSNFGRPPLSTAPSLYPPSSESSLPASMIPPVSDPFFLPPPFVPSHPHLRELCDSAVGFLHQSHSRFEQEVKSYIAAKSKEMRDLEERVRGEVELLWQKYREGPGREEETERRRSASTSRSPDRDTKSPEPIRSTTFSPPMRVNPILVETATSPGNAGSSLLSASMSANAFHAPPQTDIPDSVDDSITEMSKTFNKRSDARAVAMSHVFSVLDENMGSLSQRATRGSVSKQETNGKDSWIDGERMLLAARAASDDEGVDGRTPRPRNVKELERPDGRGKRAVAFKEPVKLKQLEDIDPELEDGSVRKDVDDDREDDVFDFELEGPPSPEDLDRLTRSPPEPAPNISRTRNMVEANLSTTFAADAPSHRAAWRRIERDGSMYASLRRDSANSDDVLDLDELAISKLATSMPLAIALPRKKVAPPVAMERKTSLSDRTGILVPPLRLAMRERGVLGSPLGENVPTPRDRSPVRCKRTDLRHGSRSASVSREREGVKTYGADPGAVFETLADENEEDEEEGHGRGDNGDGGAGPPKDKKFVPPHVIARNEDLATPDVGWRSLVSE